MRKTSTVQKLESQKYRGMEKCSKNPDEKTVQKFEAQPENMKICENLLQKRVNLVGLDFLSFYVPFVFYYLPLNGPTRAAALQQSWTGKGCNIRHSKCFRKVQPCELAYGSVEMTVIPPNARSLKIQYCKTIILLILQNRLRYSRELTSKIWVPI